MLHPQMADSAKSELEYAETIVTIIFISYSIFLQQICNCD